MEKLLNEMLKRCQKYEKMVPILEKLLAEMSHKLNKSLDNSLKKCRNCSITQPKFEVSTAVVQIIVLGIWSAYDSCMNLQPPETITSYTNHNRCVEVHVTFKS